MLRGHSVGCSQGSSSTFKFGVLGRAICDVVNETYGMTVTDYTHCELGALIELVVDHRLVDYCHMAPDQVIVSLGGKPFTFAPGEARAFLGNLMQGWARTEEQQKSVSAATDAPTSTAPVPAVTAQTLPIQSARVPVPSHNHTARGNSNGKTETGEPVVSDETYVDAVLSCAAKLRLIEGYQKDRASHRVTLRTQATTADMSYFETLEYLTGSILDELRATPA